MAGRDRPTARSRPGFSTYREDSIISRLGRGELTLEECPDEVAEVLELGREAARLSGGAFSIFLPDTDGRRRLDPSGVVKGWAAQRASQFLASLDHTDFCLSAGGDIVCHTADPDAPAWQIGIEHPHTPRSLIAVVPVRSGAVATSGTAHRGQHLVDARTGQPVEGVASVTVIGPSLTWADIDATAAYAHGPQAAEWLQNRPGRTALVVWPDATTTILPATTAARVGLAALEPALITSSRTPASPGRQRDKDSLKFGGVRHNQHHQDR